MARETKAQKNERAQLQEDYINKFYEYPNKLMEVLEKASNLFFEISVKDGVFRVVPLEYADAYELPYALNREEDWNILMNLEWSVDDLKRVKDAAKQQELKRQEILSKLSPEEKKILGI